MKGRERIKKLMLRCCVLFLAAVLLLETDVGQLTVLADDERGHDSGYIENPLYQEHADFEDPEVVLSEVSEDADQEEENHDQWDTAAEAAYKMRDAMEARETTFRLYIASTTKPKINPILTAACSEEYADSPTTGDYLKWAWSKMHWDSVETEEGSGLWVVTIQSAYYDTAEQEEEFKSALELLVTRMNLWEDSDYLRYQKIYEYVTRNVAYDSDGLSTHSEDYWGYDEVYGVNTYIDPNEDDDWLIYTAYDALCCGKAVCQGYATLIYALCRSYDLPVRIQDGSNHSWNIVKLKDQWYYLDGTWDSTGMTDQWRYFLAGTDGFSGHSPKASYQTEEYLAAYPISQTAYEPGTRELSAMPFTDCNKTEYYWESVRTLYFDGITDGISDSEFGPGDTMTRAMVVTMLYRLAGEPDYGTASFSDVPENAYYAKAAAWALAEKITTGTGPDTFSPGEPVSREQLAAFLYRYAQAAGNDISNDGTLEDYLDADQVSDYAISAMQWAVAEKIILGTGSTTLSPGISGTRAQIVTMLYRFLKDNQA